MKPKVLITGASGFVGFHLIEAALSTGLEVYAAVRKSSDIKHLQAYNINFTFPDFNDVEKLQKEIKEKEYDFIIHAAGITKARTLEDYNYVNANYTTNLAKAVAVGGSVRKLVFVSSLAAIGPSKEAGELITEEASPNPVTAYGKSKLLAEEQLKQFDLPLVILRPTAVYGPRDRDIFIILKTLAKGLEPYIGRREQMLSFLYVKDLASAAVNAFSNKACGTYNLTDGNCYNRYEMARITKELLNRKTIRFHLPHNVVRTLALVLERSYGLLKKTPALNIEKLNELTAVNWCCDIEKAKKELAFKPAYNLQQGLKEALEWYHLNKWL